MGAKEGAACMPEAVTIRSVAEAGAISSWGTDVALTPCEAGTGAKEVIATTACRAAVVKAPSGTKGESPPPSPG
jgi:hypothetical protein